MDRLTADPLTLPEGAPRFVPRGQEHLGGSSETSARGFGDAVAARSRLARNLAALHWLQVAQSTGGVNAHMQEQIARWSGWGALPHVFDERNTEYAEDRAYLREILTPALYAAASRSTINAHFTDAAIATQMWDALQGLGFTGGEVLEPGSGSGNFIGLIPEDLRGDTHVTGVEVDAVTANISRALYPDATVRTESFAETPFAPGTFDAVIGNVPFGQLRLHDPRHNPDNLPIHDHFILKAVDLVRPGGTVAVLTSRYTLDKTDSRAREGIYAQADLLGAVRLPAGAHRRAAGTDVVTDVLLFRRRLEDETPGDDTWLRTVPVEGQVHASAYFEQHSEHVLGTVTVGTGQFGPELQVHSPELDQTPARLEETLRAITAAATTAGRVHQPQGGDSSRITPTPVAITGNPLRFTGFIQEAGEGFTQVRDGQSHPFEVPKSRRDEMRALLALRDTTLALLDAEAATVEDTGDIAGLRARLNAQYDTYVQRYGPLNRVTHRRTGRVDENTGQDILARVLPRSIVQFGEDPFAAPVRSLEVYDEATGTATKAAILRGRVLERREVLTSADTPADALAICLDQRGEIDLPVIADLLGADTDAARAQLGTLVYDDPATDGLVPAAEYLSGDVRSKLAAATTAAADDDRFQSNVEALTAVVPDDLGPEEIHASLGAVWIPDTDVEAFLQETLDDPSVRVRHGAGAMWTVAGNKRTVAATSTWGTERLNALDLTTRLLQQQETVIRDEIERPEGGTVRVVNAEATDAAAEKAAALRDRFAEWVWQDPGRSARLAQAYNTMFNSIVLRAYDGEHLTLPGLAKWFHPHPHQRAAVHRIVSEPSVGLFHQVGAGKTAEMVMGTQELRRLGMVNKPAIVVPNHMLEQFTREYLALYPRANVLAAGTEDLQRDKRRLFVAKAATGDWDAIIMTRGAFQALPVSTETERTYMQREQEALRASLERLAGDTADTRIVKQMETRLANSEERLKKDLDQRRDAGLTFEQLGIDYLMVDELHDYKNMRIVSSIRDVAHDGAQRAIDLDMKIDYLRRRNGARVFTGATATPIANSVAEAYVMQRYIRPDLLDEVGIVDFDSWAATFGETVTQVELAPEGGGNYRTTTRFAKFRNVPELLRMWHVAADVKTAEDLTHLKRPELRARRDGQRLPETVLIAPSPELSEYVSDLGERAEKVRARLVPPTEDNMLKVSSEGRAAALDLRLVGQDQADDTLMPVPTKLETAAERIHSIWQTHRDDTYAMPDSEGQTHTTPGSLQIVFCDLGTPTGSAPFNVYENLRQELVARGMDPARVRFIHEANNDRKKALLFEQCRTGQVDVIIGSTSKMGVGTNIQTRAVALHHLDCPWRPADIEQREGRILRQGNLNPEVGIYRYVVEGSFDAYSWQTVERKAKFIDQIMRGTLDQREIEDLGDNTLSFNEVKALASGDPLVLERAELEQEVATLTRLERSHSRAQAGLRTRIHTAEQDLDRALERIPRIEAAIAGSTDTRGENFRARTADGRTHSNRADAAATLRHTLGAHLARLDKHTRPEAEPDQVLILGGHTFDGRVRLARLGGQDVAQVRLGDLPDISVDIDLSESGHGGITRIENAIANLPRALEAAQGAAERARREIAEAQDSIGVPFARADDLKDARDQLAQVEERMSAPKADPAVVAPAATDSPRIGDDDEVLPPDQAVSRAQEARARLQATIEAQGSRRAEPRRDHPARQPSRTHGPTTGLG
ncbi:N12 class adenine-specific DNA methylase [Marihabitans asiaticum]|uniref:N12 class adenine-specific DNA methylase n=2 Tax=Marihabitans asiaticum TaxID=415218 RepID=A0A560W601_9MICO|nr:helicase-related protein [Marihabitans asiaticum]TWD13048.1 N12 class adenine-specific DNA methylase [Marihabitans asiaticum]